MMSDTDDEYIDPGGPSSRLGTTRIAGHESNAGVVDSPPDLGRDRYRLCELIEHGGMGAVYRALDLELYREVAVKVLLSKFASNVKLERAFTNEARVMSYLSHPGVAPVYECGTGKDLRKYFVMSYIDGDTLSNILDGSDRNVPDLISIFAEVCQTIAFAHSRHVIHLDLKPSNVMVGKFGEVYVMDWGLSRFEDGTNLDFVIDSSGQESCFVADREAGRAEVGVFGTPEYMAPEQALGHAVDARTDVFGLGAILCEILTGLRPYHGNTIKNFYSRSLRRRLNNTITRIGESHHNAVLIRLTQRCLSPNPLDRPASAIEVSRELEAFRRDAVRVFEDDIKRFFELSLDLFCIAGVDGYFRRINENFSRVLGHNEDELLAHPFLDFVHEDDVDMTVQQIEILKTGQPVVRFQNRYRTASGGYVALEWMAQAVEDEGVIFAVAREVQSVTESRQ